MNIEQTIKDNHANPLVSNEMPMAAMSIQEGNRIIMTFDGWKLIKVTEDNLPFFQKFEDGKCVHDGIFHIPEYNKSFDSMIAVVEKIEKGNYGFKMCRKVVEVYYDDTKQIILKRKECSRKESLWIALVDFIQWLHNGSAPECSS